MDGIVGNGGAGAFLIHTIITIIKPLIPSNKKQLIPVISILLGVAYALIAVDGTREIKLVSGIGIGSSPVAAHESGKVFTKTETASGADNIEDYGDFPQQFYQDDIKLGA